MPDRHESEESEAQTEDSQLRQKFLNGALNPLIGNKLRRNIDNRQVDAFNMLGNQPAIEPICLANAPAHLHPVNRVTQLLLRYGNKKLHRDAHSAPPRAIVLPPNHPQGKSERALGFGRGEERVNGCLRAKFLFFAKFKPHLRVLRPDR